MRAGVIGGLGPLATAKFMEMISRRCKAAGIAVDLAVINDPKTPDRTSYILDASKPDPAPSLIAMAEKLGRFGCGLLVMPCNTASYFYKKIAAATNIPFINIVEETVKYLARCGIKKVGLLATEGTIRSGIYKKFLDEYGIELEVPDEEGQKAISSIIYESVKKGEPADLDRFYGVVAKLEAKSCRKVILGCTELSALKEVCGLSDEILLDAMDILADSTVSALKSA